MKANTTGLSLCMQTSWHHEMVSVSYSSQSHAFYYGNVLKGPEARVSV